MLLLQSQQRLAKAASASAVAPRQKQQTPQQQQRRRRAQLTVRASVVPPGSTVLVAGATGGVGQLVVAKLLERDYRVVALTRSAESAKRVFFGSGGGGGGGADTTGGKLEFAEADIRDRASVARAFEGRKVDAVVCTTGTTAFPSKRWHGGNGPRPTDLDGNLNVINAAPRGLGRFLLVTSAGVERQPQFPWLVLNLWGVLTFKRAAEIALEESGLPWTVLRPSRLVDGPYTSYDLNTLLRATSAQQGLKGVTLTGRDDLKGQASRVAVAEACVQALASATAEGRAFAIESVAEAGALAPGEDAAKWEAAFKRAAAAAAAAGGGGGAF